MTKVVLKAAAMVGLLSAYAQHVGAGPLPGDAIHQPQQADIAFRMCDANNDEALQREEMSCYNAHLANTRSESPRHAPASLERSAAAAASVANVTTAAATEGEKKKKDCEQGPLLIRRSLDDVGSFAAPGCFTKATGAEFAWANDRLLENTVWSARGIAAMRFAPSGEFKLDDPFLKSLVVAPYINFDRVGNTQAVADDVNNLTFAGVVEAGVANVFGATHYFDFAMNLVSSFAGEEKNWSANLRWHPVGRGKQGTGTTLLSYFNTPQPLGRYFVFSLTPSVRAQYAAELSDAFEQPIFAERDEAFRIGPSLLLTIDGKKVFEQIPEWVKRIHYQLSYSWLHDVFVSRDYELLDTVLKLNLDESGHFGLALSYRRGDLFETGEDVDEATVGLAVSY